MPTPVERLRAAATAARARLEAAEARERERERKRRTHAAIVVGSLLLDDPRRFGLTPDVLRVALDQLVTRPHDRRALGLDAVPAAVAGDAP